MNSYTVREISQCLEEAYPLQLQESYDNCGLQIGCPETKVEAVLLALDITELVVEEAIAKGCKMIISHHPILFRGLKSIGTNTYEERVSRLAIKNDIALYAAHTNLDNHPKGLNALFASKLGLRDPKVLEPIQDLFYKLTVYTPQAYAAKIRQCMKELSWGEQGNYTACSFTYEGEGRFIPSSTAQPHCGQQGEYHTEKEVAISVLVPKYSLSEGLERLKAVHPYEEAAIDIYPLSYTDPTIGAGIVGDLPEALAVEDFFERLKSILPHTQRIAHSDIYTSSIRRVAYCGGSGNFLWKAAAAAGADIFITGEAKYNDYHDARGKITLATIGHYESEMLAIECFEQLISQKFSNFAVVRSENGLNPIHYV